MSRTDELRKRVVFLLAALALFFAAHPAAAQAPQPLTAADSAEFKRGIEGYLERLRPGVTTDGPVAAMVQDGKVIVIVPGIRFRGEAGAVALGELRVTIAPARGSRLLVSWEHAPLVRIVGLDDRDWATLGIGSQRAEAVWDRELGTTTKADIEYRNLKLETADGRFEARSVSTAGELVELAPQRWSYDLVWRIEDLVVQSSALSVRLAEFSGRDSAKEFSLPDHVMALRALGLTALPGFWYLAGFSSNSYQQLQGLDPEQAKHIITSLADAVRRSPDLLDLALGDTTATSFAISGVEAGNGPNPLVALRRASASARRAGVKGGLASGAFEAEMSGLDVFAGVGASGLFPRQARADAELKRFPVRWLIESLPAIVDVLDKAKTNPQSPATTRLESVLAPAREAMAEARTELAIPQVVLESPALRLAIKGLFRASRDAVYLFVGELDFEADGLDEIVQAMARDPEGKEVLPWLLFFRGFGEAEPPGRGRSRHRYRITLVEDGRVNINGKEFADQLATWPRR